MSIAPTLELPRSLQWLNAPPSSLHEQRGRVVALVFVNAGSAWSWQRLRDVAQAPDGSLWILTNNTDGRGEPDTGDDRILRVPIG